MNFIVYVGIGAGVLLMIIIIIGGVVLSRCLKGEKFTHMTAMGSMFMKGDEDDDIFTFSDESDGIDLESLHSSEQ